MMKIASFGPVVSRRKTLLGLTACLSLGGASLAVAASATDRRFVVVLLRGALDGLSAVPAYGDRNFAALRGGLALPQPGQPGGVFDLGGFYGLHPSLVQLHAMYAAGDVLIVHAGRLPSGKLGTVLPGSGDARPMAGLLQS